MVEMLWSIDFVGGRFPELASCPAESRDEGREQEGLEEVA
jgi:hypothetical protein